MAAVHTERAFEEAVADHLVDNGYHRGDPADFDPEIALDAVQLFAWIEASQPRQWALLAKRHGAANVRQRFLQRLCKQLDELGTLEVLRKGVIDYGVKIELCTFRPAHRLSPEVQRRYDLNRLSVTRQVRYNPRSDETIDLVLFVNGIPVATAELKNQLTGQIVEHAIRQYRHDRDPRQPLLAFKRRAVVHFAADTDLVFMTTRLQGPATEFLPFNRGRGSGTHTGAGNPDNPTGYRTAYLWEEIWQRDSWLDILGRFVHLERVEKKDREGKAARIEESLIFPRYHQLTATRMVEADARRQGPGQKYLIQHSAGSGKSNTIGWLAHGLYTLHDEEDNLLFDTIVVVTDRRVLDRQLQGTVAQFEQTPGIVMKIEHHSGELAEALSEGRHIIITTLQKFPFVVDRVAQLAGRTFAVIIDEAHSSQTGEAARKMRMVLSDDVNPADAVEEIETDWEDEVGEAVGRLQDAPTARPNLTFVALTATPKFKTIEIFGTPGIDGKPHAFHVYSMRQAIEEGFILDVLKNYITYGLFWQLQRNAPEDPEVDPHRARAAIARFVSLHPYNIAQKTEIIVEHFRNFGRDRIGGRAKAMVVTRSRLQAVRYKLAFDRYLRQHGYTDIKALVAFSGEVRDPDLGGEPFTEPGMNGFPESRLPEKFAGDDYQVLLVAEKYQTGYDQPLLHSMYVDKRLDGVKAVQTLSRLNRTCPGKEDTFVLDFVNKPDDIRKAFEPYYDATEITETTDPNLLYDLKARLDGYQLYSQDEVDAAYAALTGADTKRAPASAALNHAIDPAVTRFSALDRDDQEELKHLLTEFTRLHSFMLNVLPYRDPGLDRFYEYARFLLRKLPRRELTDAFPVEEYVELSRYRLFLRENGPIELGKESGDYALSGPNELGAVRAVDVVKQQLSSLIEKLNALYGAELTENDGLTLTQLEEHLIADPRLAEQARANDEEHYSVGFDDAFDDAVIDLVLRNERLFARLQDNAGFKRLVKEHIRPRVYGRQRHTGGAG
jgi:type I restriction enzyme R subunit